MSHNTEECAKLPKKRTLGSKNEMRNLVNFNVGSGELLFSIVQKVSAKKV